MSARRGESADHAMAMAGNSSGAAKVAEVVVGSSMIVASDAKLEFDTIITVRVGEAFSFPIGTQSVAISIGPGDRFG